MAPCPCGGLDFEGGGFVRLSVHGAGQRGPAVGVDRELVRGARESDVGLLAVDELDAVVRVDRRQDAAHRRALGGVRGDGVGIVERQRAATGLERDHAAAPAVQLEDDAAGGSCLPHGGRGAVGDVAPAVGAAPLDAVTRRQLARLGAREIAAAQPPRVVAEAGAVAMALDHQRVALPIHRDHPRGVAGPDLVDGSGADVGDDVADLVVADLGALRGGDALGNSDLDGNALGRDAADRDQLAAGEEVQVAAFGAAGGDHQRVTGRGDELLGHRGVPLRGLADLDHVTMGIEVADGVAGAASGSELDGGE